MIARSNGAFWLFFVLAISFSTFFGAAAVADESKKVTAVVDKQTSSQTSQTVATNEVKQGVAGTTALFKSGILPASVTFNASQLADIQAAIAQNYVTYYHSLIAQNAAAAYGHEYYQTKAKQTIADDQWQLTNTRVVLQRHRFFSEAIFWMVILIVLISLVLTIYQFTQGNVLMKVLIARALNSNAKRASTSAKNLSEDSPSLREAGSPDILALVKENTELELSLTGVKIKSQVIGLIMLAFSMGFFYLYLVHVYPITVVQTKIPSGSHGDAGNALDKAKEKK